MYENTGVTRVSWRHCINLQSLLIPFSILIYLKCLLEPLRMAVPAKRYLELLDGRFYPAEMFISAKV